MSCEALQEKSSQSYKVTRLGEFSFIGRLHTLGSGFENYISSPHFGLLFSTVPVMYLFWAKMGWVPIWATFSKTYLVTLQVGKCLKREKICGRHVHLFMYAHTYKEITVFIYLTAIWRPLVFSTWWMGANCCRTVAENAEKAAEEIRELF
jgi:hypothetical protein